MQTPIDVGGDASQVLVGSVSLRIAPTGTTLPNLDGTSPIVWPSGWEQLGYTDAGVELSYSPSVKEIKVDEELSPVMFVLDGEKCEVTAALAEATLANLNRAISASTLDADVADSTHAAISTLKFGSGNLNEVMVGFEGYAPGSTDAAPLKRIMIGHRAMAQANVKLAFKRADKVVTPVTFGLLADSSKAVGERLATIVDFTAVATGS